MPSEQPGAILLEKPMQGCVVKPHQRRAVLLSQSILLYDILLFTLFAFVREGVSFHFF